MDKIKAEISDWLLLCAIAIIYFVYNYGRGNAKESAELIIRTLFVPILQFKQLSDEDKQFVLDTVRQRYAN